MSPTVGITTTRTPADQILHVLLGTEEGRQDPYLLYKALRDIAPLFRSELEGITLPLSSPPA